QINLQSTTVTNPRAIPSTSTVSPARTSTIWPSCTGSRRATSSFAASGRRSSTAMAIRTTPSSNPYGGLPQWYWGTGLGGTTAGVGVLDGSGVGVSAGGGTGVAVPAGARMAVAGVTVGGGGAEQADSTRHSARYARTARHFTSIQTAGRRGFQTAGPRRKPGR